MVCAAAVEGILGAFIRMTTTRRIAILSAVAASAITLMSCSTVGANERQAGEPAGDFGVLVMAHGAGPAWNGEVEEMLASLREDHPLEIAFGMAEAASLQNAVTRLEERGVRRIAVVRLFISGESWYERTEQILGLAPGAEPRSEDHATHGGHDAHGGHAGHGGGMGHDMALWRIESRSSFAISKQGLAEAPEMGAVLVERVRGLSQEPARESVLVLAHGPETDEENERWLSLIDARADAVRRAGSFRRVQTETLREDWPEKRAASEARIRAFVEQALQDNGRVIVIPYRVAGFGPYADVLKGFDYVADQKGLLPSADVERWVRRQVKELRAGPFRAPQHVHDAA
jgi:sirohydrochlorin ferrochelatase